MVVFYQHLAKVEGLDDKTINSVYMVTTTRLYFWSMLAVWPQVFAIFFPFFQDLESF